MTPEQMDWFNDPYPDYARLRAHDGPLWMPHRENYESDGIWLFSRYHDTKTVLKQKSGITKYVRAKRLPSERTAFDIHMLNRDGSEHARLRQLVANFFSSKSIRSIESTIRARASELIQAAAQKGQTDAISAIAEPLPLVVIADIIGMPQADIPRIRQWSLTISEGADSRLVDSSLMLRRKEAIAALLDYTNWLLDNRRDSLNDDLISRMLHAEHDGQVSREETQGMIMLLLFAGHETTINLIGNMLWLMLTHTDQWKKAQASPDLARRAVEETLRYESPTQRSTYRFTSEPINLCGIDLEPGQQVAVILGSANRDECVFDQPDIFDIERSPNRHLAFGIGEHNCLGKTLARTEARIVLEELLSANDRPQVCSEQPAWKRNSLFRGLQTLPIRFNENNW